jgi:hypothetical protein
MQFSSILGNDSKTNALTVNSTINTSSINAINITYTNLIMTDINPTTVIFQDNSALVSATPSLDYTTFAQSWALNGVSPSAWNGICISACGMYQCACISGGGIMYSVNYGQTWSVSNAPTASWQSIAMSASGMYVSACIYGGYIWYSTDYGQTWAMSGYNFQWHGISMSSSGKYQIACISGGGIMYSVDYGYSWTSSSAATLAWYAISMSSSGKYVTACVNNGAIWYSTDYGISWTQSSAPSTYIWSSISMSASGKFQTATAAYNGVWYSTTFGVSWTQVSNGTITPLNMTCVCMSSSGQFQTITVMIGINVGAVWYSTNFGVTWIYTTSLPNAQAIAMSSTGAYITAVANFGNIYTSVISQPSLITSGKIGVGISNPIYSLQLATDSAGKPGSNTWTIVSDERIKTNIQLADTNRCCDIIKAIPLKRYTWRDDVYTSDQVSDRSKLGWIAQDVEKLIPKAVSKNRFTYNPHYEEKEFTYQTMINGEIVTQTATHSVLVEDTIEDCRDLDTDQIYAVMYGALQKVIADNERLTQQISSILARLG